MNYQPNLNILGSVFILFSLNACLVGEAPISVESETLTQGNSTETENAHMETGHDSHTGEEPAQTSTSSTSDSDPSEQPPSESTSTTGTALEPECGNGVQEDGEACDYGAQYNHNHGACTLDCAWNIELNDLTIAGLHSYTAASKVNEVSGLLLSSYDYKISALESEMRVLCSTNPENAEVDFDGQLLDEFKLSPILPVDGSTHEIIVHQDEKKYQRHYAFDVSHAPLRHAQTILSHNFSESDRFGESIAVNNKWLVIGAPDEDGMGSGINSLQDGDDKGQMQNRGAVYVFHKQNDMWIQDAYLKAHNNSVDASNQNFGYSVALEDDTIVVGAPHEHSGSQANPWDVSSYQSGAVYVFKHDGKTWQQDAYLKSPTIAQEANFGESVTISGHRIVIGEPRAKAANSGAVHIFHFNLGDWSHIKSLYPPQNPSSALFGTHVMLDNKLLAIGAPNETVLDKKGAGTVYLYQSGFMPKDWDLVQRFHMSTPQSGAHFGYRVVLDQDRLIVTAITQNFKGEANAGVVHLYQRVDNKWPNTGIMLGSLTPKAYAQFGTSIALLSHMLIVGDPNSLPLGLDKGKGQFHLIQLNTPTPTRREILAQAQGLNKPNGLGQTLTAHGKQLFVGQQYGPVEVFE